MGIESRPDPFLPTRRKWFFAIYSLAAAAYRWFITFSIFWFLYSLLEPYGVKVIGQAIAMMAIWGLLGMPLLQAYRFFSVPGRFGTVDKGQTILSACVCAAALIGIMMIPIPRFVRCPFIIQPAGVENVFVDVPGKLSSVYVSMGDPLEPGQPVLSLQSDELDLQIAKLESKVKSSQLEYEIYQRAAQSVDSDENVANEVALAETQLANATQDLKLRQQDLRRLTVVSPVKGSLVPPAKIQKRGYDAESLNRWHGYPTEERNIGSYMEQGTIVGRIVPNPKKLEAVLAVDQSEIEFVRNGQSVELFPVAIPGSTIASKVREISTSKMKSVPKGLSSRFGGELIATRNEEGNDVPQSTTYQVSVPFELDSELLADGCTGKAKIRAGSQTIGQRLIRLVQKTFRFDL